MMDLHQRLRALERANKVRIGQARLKDRVHADPTWRELAAVVRGDPAVEPLAARTMVVELLKAAPGIGRSAARRILGDAGIHVHASGWERLRLGDLAPERRHKIAAAIENAHTTRDPAALERMAGHPRPGQRQLRTEPPA